MRISSGSTEHTRGASALRAGAAADRGDDFHPIRINDPRFVLVGEEAGDADVGEGRAQDDTPRAELMLGYAASCVTITRSSSAGD